MQFRVSTIESIYLAVKKSNFSKLIDWINGENAKTFSQIESSIPKNHLQKPRRIAFVAPQLPHSCELEIWNELSLQMGVEAAIYTAVHEEKNFIQFTSSMNALNKAISMTCYLMDTMPENKTFLGGIEKELESYPIIVSYGENSLASYQSAKIKRNHHSKLIVWQNSPRPPYANIGVRSANGAALPQLARERTVRKEILKNIDMLLCFDKDGSTWAFLENVGSQRIRRLSRCVNANRFSQEASTLRRIELRKVLGLPETDFIFMHLGPLEVESGSIDSVLAFKNLLQSNPSFHGQARLCFCGTGSAAPDIRQCVVEQGLDDHVYFLNPNGDGSKEVIGNQFHSILSVCDVVIHASLTPVNGNAIKCLDSTYDLLCALASGIMVITNGHGWIGEWISRFYKTFAAGSVHSLGRLMQETIDKQDKLTNVKNAIKKAISNEFQFEKTISELIDIFNSLNFVQTSEENQTISNMIENIEELISNKLYVDAIQLISEAFQQSDISTVQRSNLFRLIADCFTKLGDLANGVDNYTRSIDLDPYNSRSYIGLGTVALQRGEYNIAVPQFQKAVSLAPNDDMASLGLGLSFEGLLELKEAIQWTTRSCQLNPDNTVAIYNLSKLSYELEEFLELEKALIRYVSRHPNDINMIYSLGGLYFKLGNIISAQQLMETILIIDPMNGRAHALISEINKAKQQKKHA